MEIVSTWQNKVDRCKVDEYDKEIKIINIKCPYPEGYLVNIRIKNFFLEENEKSITLER